MAQWLGLLLCSQFFQFRNLKNIYMKTFSDIFFPFFSNIARRVSREKKGGGFFGAGLGLHQMDV